MLVVRQEQKYSHRHFWYAVQAIKAPPSPRPSSRGRGKTLGPRLELREVSTFRSAVHSYNVAYVSVRAPGV
jgi:hypothetical protein